MTGAISSPWSSEKRNDSLSSYGPLAVSYCETNKQTNRISLQKSIPKQPWEHKVLGEKEAGLWDKINSIKLVCFPSVTDWWENWNTMHFDLASDFPKWEFLFNKEANALNIFWMFSVYVRGWPDNCSPLLSKGDYCEDRKTCGQITENHG